MATRRMFSREITESDAFCEMPLSSQALYFHLGMVADDDGVVNSVKRIARSIGANEDDLRILAARKFIIPFESGVIVIKHWRINNYIRGDRKRDSKYEEVMARLTVQDNGSYSLCGQLCLDVQADDQALFGMPDTCQSHVSQMPDKCQHRLGKDRIGEDRETLSGKPDFSEQIGDIVGYLNAKTGKTFRTSTKNTVKLINARLKEGYSVDDFKKVIDTKVAQWARDPKFSAYLQPSTLFAPSHFENYLNEVTVAVGRGAGKYAKYD